LDDRAVACADGSKGRFYSSSAQIVSERKQSYRELERVQRGGVDITPWLAWFIGCLGGAIDRSEDTLGAVIAKARVWREQSTSQGLRAGTQMDLGGHPARAM